MKDFIGEVLLKFVMMLCYTVIFVVYAFRLFFIFEEIIYYVYKFLCESYFERKSSRK